MDSAQKTAKLPSGQWGLRRAMGDFIGSFEGRRDGKSRVAVPAAFRSALREAASGDTLAVVLYPSHSAGCIECWSPDGFAAYVREETSLYELKEDADAIRQLMSSDAQRAELDGDGRIVLPAKLALFAGLGEKVTFLSSGEHFEIWATETAERQLAETRARLAATASTRKLRNPHWRGA